MRILILGNNYSAKSYLNFFQQDKNNIVFTTIRGEKNYIEFNLINDIVDFCQANELNLVLITDEDYVNLGLQETISAINISAFSPSSEAIGITVSKNYAKKFMHRNKIKTPKFSVHEKPQSAIDYIKENGFPVAIKPDNHNIQECSLFCETLNQAKNIVNNFFESGNKKIIVEDYVEGKSLSVWVLTDGYSAKIIGTSAKYQNNIALFNPEFVNEDLEQNLYQNFINPTIQALSSQDEEYIGILGFDFILTYNNELYLLGYNSFFDDLNVDFYTKGFDINWADVFDSTIIGDVFLKYDFKIPQSHMITIKQDENIDFLSANTKNALINYIQKLDYDTKELQEATRIWRF